MQIKAFGIRTFLIFEEVYAIFSGAIGSPQDPVAIRDFIYRLLVFLTDQRKNRLHKSPMRPPSHENM